MVNEFGNAKLVFYEKMTYSYFYDKIRLSLGLYFYLAKESVEKRCTKRENA